MEILELPKPIKRSKSHFKALLYTELYRKGFDVYIDVVSRALVKFTNDLKGYKQVKFDIVIYVDKDPKLLVMVDPTNRRGTKARFFGIPIISLHSEKYKDHQTAYKEIISKIIGD
jgi:hypothetical protein